MIILIGLLVVAIIIAEIFLFKEKSKQKVKIENIKKLNTQLDILKALSYIPISKRQDILEDLNDFSFSFFIQNKFSVFSLISNQNNTNQMTIWRYKRNEPAKQKDNSPSDTKLNALEESLLSEAKEQVSFPVVINNLSTKWTPNSDLPTYQSAVIIPLIDNDLKFGYLILYSEEGPEIDKDEIDFLNSVGKICTMVMLKWYICSKLSMEEQFKAVNTVW